MAVRLCSTYLSALCWSFFNKYEEVITFSKIRLQTADMSESIKA